MRRWPDIEVELSAIENIVAILSLRDSGVVGGVPPELDQFTDRQIAEALLDAASVVLAKVTGEVAR